jgi:hypothetical protein
MFSSITPYNWNIVEGGIKHHNPNLKLQTLYSFKIFSGQILQTCMNFKMHKY